ncbi:MAG: hypothetical protein LBQ00_02245 [Syntrophobacterales bacterium]|jgi:NADH pyrophosphatase NudC (nudix superfamily)|nr:hypothetical protein [Syntrophobacterales bacterium]
MREIREELMYKLHEHEYFGNFPYDGYDIFMYRKIVPGLFKARYHKDEIYHTIYMEINEAQYALISNCLQAVFQSTGDLQI